ncbi:MULTISPECIES: hypothetical protein [Phyllobacteriaceae]|jgi:hypothetical protein|uniref:Uncharacterized protein n=1 Tax=Mesorhizobium hungaricum TaxID=1566387 RepID=A0A1C2DD09_9HYPH|nr:MULTISPECIES: hypothetical protein [Mesorhizobium]MBN9235155.1 hypothetical protein [Mesorhizobium sp.]OCX12648.1 hypothetical protein QV13_23915 [Mesorhizobium hungaricum]
MEAELIRHLELLLAAYREKVDRAESTIGRFCAGDGDFFDRLRSGKGFNVRTYDRVARWFLSNWPTNASWPDDVPRPTDDASVDEAAVQEAAE